MIRLISDFPCGNGKLVDVHEQENGPVVKFRAETKFGEPQPNWFYFRLEGLSGKQARLYLANARQCLDDFGALGWRDNHPVYRVAEGQWQRVTKVEARLSEWRVPEVFFDIPVLAPTMEVAFCYPYRTIDLEKTIRECPALESTVIGYSTHGRPILRVSNNFGDESRQRKGAFIIGRQHAAEVSGAWVLDGIMRFIASEEGQSLTKNQMWWFVPITDPDGVEEGAYGKDQSLGDLNRSWGAPFPNRTELHAIEHDMDRWAEFSQASYFLDMHSPGNDRHGMELLLYKETGEHNLEGCMKLTESINAQLTKAGFEPAVVPDLPAGHNTSAKVGMKSTAFASTTYGAISVCVETSSWGPLTKDKIYTIDDYHKIGESIARALIDLMG